MNIPDTVNDTRVRALTEPYGRLVKIVLRPDHQGAIVEYLDASDAGKASLGLEGYEIVPGRSIRVGTVPEMLKQSADKHTDKILVGKQKRESDKPAPSNLMSSVPIRRPGQGGRRGGCGFAGAANPASSNTVVVVRMETPRQQRRILKERGRVTTTSGPCWRNTSRRMGCISY